MRKITLAIAITLFLFPLKPFAGTVDQINALLNQGKFQQALTEIELGLFNNPDNETIMLQKGFVLINLGRLKEAEEYYKDLIKKLPDNPEPRNNLGVTYQIQKQFEKAIEQLKETIKVFPNFTPAYENLGDTYIQIATSHYLNGITTDPEYHILISKADVGQQFHWLAQQNIESAISRFRQNKLGSESAVAASDSGQANTRMLDIDESQLTTFLRSWVNAWSRQDVDGYLSHYAGDFSPSGGFTLSAWKKRKRHIISNAEFINIEVTNIEVIDYKDDIITLQFNQDYKSNTFESVGSKALTLRLNDATLEILSEESI